MPHYFCKLRPPRPTFISDMTSDEAQLMRAHREYWTPQVETGVVIAMGPVADPSGGYGVAIIEAASEASFARTWGALPDDGLTLAGAVRFGESPYWGAKLVSAS